MLWSEGNPLELILLLFLFHGIPDGLHETKSRVLDLGELLVLGGVELLVSVLEFLDLFLEGFLRLFHLALGGLDELLELIFSHLLEFLDLGLDISLRTVQRSWGCTRA